MASATSGPTSFKSETRSSKKKTWYSIPEPETSADMNNSDDILVRSYEPISERTRRLGTER